MALFGANTILRFGKSLKSSIDRVRKSTHLVRSVAISVAINNYRRQPRLPPTVAPPTSTAVIFHETPSKCGDFTLTQKMASINTPMPQRRPSPPFYYLPQNSTHTSPRPWRRLSMVVILVAVAVDSGPSHGDAHRRHQHHPIWHLPKIASKSGGFTLNKHTVAISVAVVAINNDHRLGGDVHRHRQHHPILHLLQNCAKIWRLRITATSTRL